MVFMVFIYDFKFDVFVFEIVLCLLVVYVGVMGFWCMYDDWLVWLCEVGFIEVELDCFSLFIGFDFGVCILEEMVVLVVVEIV